MIGMNPYFKKTSFTLIELVIGMAVLGIIILAVSQLDLFSNASLIYSQRRIDLTNEASLALEHISGHLSQAIGDINRPAAVNGFIAADRALFYWVDSNANFMRDATDTRRVYRWTAAVGPTRYILRFCDSCGNNPCTVCNAASGATVDGITNWGVVIARHVNYFGKPQNDPPAGPGDVALIDNHAAIEIQTCNNPAAANCNTPKNPQVNMQATIRMPGCSTN